jgi:lipoprotein-releasing system ATP-binding protein
VGAGERRARAREALAAVGLEHRLTHSPSKLSGGERQRVAIARALANDPALVLGDEPTGNLDSENSARVVKIFQRMAHEQGRAVVFVTHDLNVAAAADVRIHMLDGAIDRID